MPSTIKHNPMRLPRWAWWLVILAMLGLAAASVTLRSPPGSDPAQSQWIRVDPQPLESRLGLVGRIEASNYLTIAAPFDAGVEALTTVVGQRVERGQRLLMLDTLQLDIQLRQAQAEQLKAWRVVQDMERWEQSQDVARARRALSNTRMGLSDTERKLHDTQGLLKRGIVPRMEVDALVQQLRVQRLDLSAAEAELDAALAKGKGENRLIAQMELKNTQSRYQALQALHAQREIKAPFAGIVLRPPNPLGSGMPLAAVQSGTRVTQGTPLFELANLEQLQAVARVEEVDIHQLQEGQLVDVTGDGFEGLTLSGRVQSIGVKGIAAEASGAGATYEVIVSFAPLNAELQKRVRLGMSARLSIVIYTNPNAMVIPPEALLQSATQGLRVNYRSEMNQPPQAVPLTLGRATPQGVEVSGLASGYVEINEPSLQ